MTALQYFYNQMEKLYLPQGIGKSRWQAPFYKKFLDFCEINNFEMITKETVDSWLKYYKYNTNKTKASHIGLIRNLSTFINFLGGTAYIPDEEYSFKIEHFNPIILNSRQLSELFTAIDKENKPTYSILFRLMYCCGLRPGEAVRIKRNDFDVLSGNLYIYCSKYNKDRHIITSEDIRRLCERYDSSAGIREYFFSNKDSKIETQRLSGFLRRVIQKNNLYFAKGFRPYDFRHNFATQNIMNWLDKDLDIMTMLPYLSTYMGHKKFSYTYYYIHLLPERLLQSKNVDWNRLKKVYADEELYGKD